MGKDVYTCNDITSLIDKELTGSDYKDVDYETVRKENLEKISKHHKSFLDELNKNVDKIISNSNNINQYTTEGKKDDYNYASKQFFNKYVQPLDTHLTEIHKQIITDILKNNKNDIDTIQKQNTNYEFEKEELEKYYEELENKTIFIKQNINSLEKEYNDNKNLNDNKSKIKNKLMYTNITIAGLVFIGLLFINIIPFFMDKDKSKFTFIHTSDFKNSTTNKTLNNNTNKTINSNQNKTRNSNQNKTRNSNQNKTRNSNQNKTRLNTNK